MMRLPCPNCLLELRLNILTLNIGIYLLFVFLLFDIFSLYSTKAS